MSFDIIKYACFVLPGTDVGLPDALVILVLAVTSIRFVLLDRRRFAILYRFFVLDAFLLGLRYCALDHQLVRLPFV
jgi:hypothetical protein